MENMTFETFGRIACSNKVAVIMAMDLLLQNGRSFVMNNREADLVAAMESCTGNLISEQTLQDIVSMAKSLAQLGTGLLLAYIKKSGLDVSMPGGQAEGICPVCGSRIDYNDDIPMDDTGVRKWTCPDCGASGLEEYRKLFERHCNVMDGAGNPYRAPKEG